MIRQINLKHFKCFTDLKLPLRPLTVLTGLNASGKSSAIQALVLLSQTMRDHEWSRRLLLNGTDLSLGTMVDVVDKIAGRHSFSIGVETGERGLNWIFESENRGSMSAALAEVEAEGSTWVPREQQPVRYLLPVGADEDDVAIARTLHSLSYLTAERMGPREIYTLEEPGKSVGVRGERAASVLHWGGDQTVIPSLVLDTHAPTRLRQVEARMQQFFPGSSLQITPVPQTNGVTLGLRTSDATGFHRPIHVGFGLTQVFPILVAALSSDPGDLLIIENPEVHLHPAGQSAAGIFLASVAAAGVQVIIETHSDHVLNGVRRAVKSGGLSHQAVALHFFRPPADQVERVTTVAIDQEGNLDHWPAGFFDQFDRDMNYFAGWND